MATTTITRLVNNWFRDPLNIDGKTFGVYTPPQNRRVPPDYCSSSVVESEEDFYYVWRECPVLTLEGKQVYDENGKPMMQMKEVQITKAEHLAEMKTQAQTKLELERIEREQQEEERSKVRNKHLALFKKKTQGADVCTIKSSGQIMRALGHPPTMNEICLIHDTFGESLTLDQLYQGLDTVQKSSREDQLTDAFLLWDYRQTGCLSRKQMINILCAYGDDPLTEKEAYAVLQATRQDNDTVEYKSFVEDLYEISSRGSSCLSDSVGGGDNFISASPIHNSNHKSRSSDSDKDASEGVVIAEAVGELSEGGGYGDGGIVDIF